MTCEERCEKKRKKRGRDDMNDIGEKGRGRQCGDRYSRNLQKISTSTTVQNPESNLTRNAENLRKNRIF